MLRISLFFSSLFLSVVQLAAQSGGNFNLEFIENKGQWDTTIRFNAGIGTGNLFMQRKGFTVLLHDTNDMKRIGLVMHGDLAAAGVTETYSGYGGGKKAASISPGMNYPVKPGNPGNGGDPFLLHSHAYRVSFENANDGVQITGDKVLDSYNNYFIGDQKHWAAQCKIFQGIWYRNMYDGIDVHYYSDRGFVKYDIVVHPGADPSKIILKYEGQDKLSIRKNKIYVQTSVGTVTELEPRSYQVSDSGRTDVECSYSLLSGNRIQFKVKNHSPGATLVIDPTEVFCSFTGSRSDNWGYTATYDRGGNFYMGGIVLDESDQNYQGPNGSGWLASPGAFQTTFQGGDGSEGDGYNYDVAIMKLNSSGTKRVFATYLGGSGDEQPHSMIVDNGGNLIVTGRTSSPNFPNTSGNPSGGSFDLFVTKFNSNGTALLGSRRIGGSGWDGVNFGPKYLINGQYPEGAQQLRLNYGDDGRSEVILDNAGNVYIAACTQSADFPVTGGVFQGSSGGGQDGVLMKLSPDLGTVIFSSYLGGSGADAAFVLALNPLDNTIWVAGGTLSNDLMGTGNTRVAGNHGGIDGFISQISNDGSTVLKTLYFGTTANDMIYGLDFDKYGFPYIVGTTDGVVPVVASPFNNNTPSQSNGKQFITKLKQDLSGVVYSANFGPGNVGHPNISPTAFLVDRCQNVYVAGWGGGPDSTDHYANSGTWNLPITAGALKTITDGEDFYFFVLQKNAASQLYGSYFGQQYGNFGDHVDGGTSRFDQQGVIYEGVCANCYLGATFPTTPGVWASTNGAGRLGCNEAGVKIAFNYAGVAAGLKVVTHGRGDSVGCVPLTATFSDTIRNAKSYIWNFGDGTVINNTTSYTENHTYTSAGTYKVTLIAIDSNTCNVADTVTHLVEMKNDPAFLDFRYDKTGPCQDFNYVFTNLSTLGQTSPPFSDTAFTWSFGDGTVLRGQGLTSKPTHSYAAPGPYKVTLTLMDTSYCNFPLDTTRILYVAQNDTARFTTPKYGCAPYTAVFTNTSIAGQTFYWNFGDGSPIDSVDISPMHLYSNIGSYPVTLTAVDSTTCNITSTYSFTITVQGKPTAGFTYTPVPPQPPNTPTIFTDESTPAVKYQWFFGDGTEETKTTPDTVIHQYNRTDTFEVCEVVTNASGCTDTACHSVPAVINPLLDVPNAFTPGRFGVNGVIKVVGFGITHMTWRIYNRWGQLVFESIDPYVGWDGIYHGTLQPMDVYAYTLEAEFSDGTHATKKGDITLIR
ncbi:DUF7948 domain-containing protein [Puia dinghuensis]|uniref:PKD domain-containing protein n=1 Tax=Puia dinghuensis TaxID=1792502 RepID=A0A8J2XV66_9BACT|nr:PKD domain-containing protein [Puia dinghuensis]GGB16456.1 hypothetical protein GCM10011511_45350 [Puia dinghuensis]